MRASVFLLIPMALGWGLMLLVLGPVVLVVRHAGAGALLVRARWAAALACQRLEAHLYARVGGAYPSPSPSRSAAGQRCPAAAYSTQLKLTRRTRGVDRARALARPRRRRARRGAERARRRRVPRYVQDEVHADGPAARDALDAAIVGVKLVLAAVLLAFGTALLADLVALGRFRVLAAARAHALPLPRRWGGCVVKLLA